MPLSLFWQSLLAWRRVWWAWAALIALLALGIEALYPALETGLAASGWAAGGARFLRQLAGASPADWVHAAGFQGLFAWAAAAFAICMGSRLLAGEREKRTLALLLAYPRSRLWFLLEAVAALFAAVLMQATALWLLLAAGAAVFRLPLAPAGLAAAAGLLALFGLVFGSLALALSMWSGSARIGGLGAAGALLLAYLSFTLLPAMGGAARLRQLSLFSVAFGANPLEGGFNLGGGAILLLLSLGLLALAWAGFERLDLV